MLQSIAVWFLKDYVGEYVENFNTEQLTIGYGGVELEKLLLKKTALQSLKLPIKLSSGFIGKLHLVIPYANPNTHPWVIQIEDLFLSIIPETEVGSDDEDFSGEEKEKVKRKMLDKLEAEWKKNMQNHNKTSWWSSGSWFPSFYSSFSTKIVDNLQLEIKNVHFRYENSAHKTPYSFGIKIGSLSTQTTNDSWEKSTVQQSTEKKYKLVELNDLSIYNDDVTLSPEEFDKELTAVRYMLNPVSAEARVCRNASKSPLTSEEGPRFNIGVMFDAVGLELTNKQYKIITELVEEFTRHFRAKQNKKWRPLVSVFENPKAWWRFSIQTMLEPIKDKHRRERKDVILQHVKNANTYIPLYSKHVLHTSSESLNEEPLKELEKAMEFEQIAALRKIVYSRLTNNASSVKLAEETAGIASTQSWTSWAMSYIPYSGSQVKQPESMQMTAEEEKFLQELSESYSQDEESLYKRDATFTQISFALQSGSVLLKSGADSHDVFLDVSVDKLRFTSEVLLKSQYFEWTASLGAMTVKNPEVEELLFPALFQPTQSREDFQEKSFLEISFGQKRIFSKIDYRLSILLQPSTLVYKPMVLTQLKEFFAIQDSSRYKLNLDSMSSRLRRAINSQIEVLKNATKTELANVVSGLIKRHTQHENQWNVNLDLAAPRIIMPLHGDTIDTEVAENMVVVNLGRITFCNERAKAVQQAAHSDNDELDDDDDDEFVTPSSTPPHTADMEESMLAMCETLPAEEIREKFYDSYTLELSLVQILVCSVKDTCALSQLKGFGPDHVVEECSVSCSLKRRIVFTTDPELPALIFTTVLPQLLVHVDEKKLQTLYTCFNLLTKKPTSLQSVHKEKEILSDIKKSSEPSTIDDVLDINTEELLVESKLLMAKFTFEKISLGLHSRGRCFAELQLQGIECEVTKRPCDLSVSFILSSLLLIDAIQTFGAEYDLLVSSNDPAKKEEGNDGGVLISVNYELINENCPSLESNDQMPLHILSVNFNSLFINGNLETIVELNNVLNQITPKKSSSTASRYFTNGIKEQPANIEVLLNVEKTDIGQANNKNIEVAATFKELEILLFRSVSTGDEKTPLRLAKVTVCELELVSKMSRDTSINGSIGSISLTNLLPCDNLFQQHLFMVGSVNADESLINTLDANDEPIKAFTFDMRKVNDAVARESGPQRLDIHLASAYYIHNPHLLGEMLLYAGDYKQYALNLAKSIKVAASDMAKSIVSSVPRRSHETLSNDGNVEDHSVKPEMSSSSRMQFFVVVETPVVLFPRDTESLEFVVGHLGRITVNNDWHSNINPTEKTSDVVMMENNDRFTTSLRGEPTEKVVVEIEKINLSVLHFVQDERCNDVVDILRHQSHNQTAILHNTDLYLQFERIVTDGMMNTARIVGKINSTLRLFLSVPIYQQVLSTLKYSTNVSSSSQTNMPGHSVVLPVGSSLQVPVSDQVISNDSLKEESSHVVVKEEGNTNNIMAEFKMPCLQIELHGELNGKSCGFVLVEFNRFELDFNNAQRPFTTTAVTLQSFTIRDLLHESEDKFCYLLSSSQESEVISVASKAERFSSSYPEERAFPSLGKLSMSMPDILNEEDDNITMDMSDGTCVKNSVTHGPLISLKFTTVSGGEKDDGDVMDNSGARKSMDIAVSNLELVINLQTWVILLEFFGIGVQSPATSPAPSSMNTSEENLSLESLEEVTSSTATDLNVNIGSLVFYINKELYPLAKASVSGMCLNVVLDDGNQDVSGSIGKVALMDLSPYKGLYGVRLLSSGDKAVDFTFFRFGKPDPDLKREHDIDLTLSMSALQYVHTQRFLIEVISFCQHFVFLQEVLQRMRAANAGKEVSATLNRCARVNLKVDADAPILILPRKSLSPDLLVANLGKLSVSNEFLYASNPATNGYKFSASRARHSGDNEQDSDEDGNSLHGTDRLLDCIQIKLSDMEVYSGLKIESRTNKIVYVGQGERMMIKPCSLHLVLERNLEWAFGRQVPDMFITGHLSTVSLNLDLSQFSLIMGMLGENLGEQLDVFQAPSSVIIDPLIFISNTNQLWTTLRIQLHLSDVTLETTPSFSFGPFKDMSSSTGSNGSDNEGRGKLGKFDFLNSQLIYESFSDGSKTVNLVSTDVLLHDIRTTANTDILSPCQRSERRGSNYLQFEIHYLDTKQQSTVTFLCNQSRILLQFEFLLQTLNFVMRKEENRLSGKDKQVNTHQPHISSSVITKSDVAVVASATSNKHITKETTPTTPKKTALKKKHFELKVNITESELVLVEDITSADSRTVILKTTAVFSFRPDHFSERPVTCSLQSLEIFSCLLSRPDDSALSIVDPVAFLVELNNVNKLHESESGGLLDVVARKPTLEIQLQVPVKIRLSYNDVRMFKQIIDSARKQITSAFSNGASEGVNTKTEKPTDKDSDVKKRRPRRRSAHQPLNVTAESHPQSTRFISGFDVKTTLISITIIDDCGDNDVPLLDTRFNSIVLHHDFIPHWKGSAQCHLDVNYYNTRVSAWEPFLENWKFNVHCFNALQENEREKLVIKVDAPERLDMNLTSAFVDITKTTASLWSSRMEEDEIYRERKRVPFQPFALRNQSGVKIKFNTMSLSPRNNAPASSLNNMCLNDTCSDVFNVDNGGEIPFSYENRSKQRHQATHSLTVHQIIVSIPGWQQIKAITVDRVGQFYRIAKYEDNANTNQITSPRDIYILIDINLEGARKVITIHSALTVLNELSVPVELMVALNSREHSMCVLPCKSSYHIPVQFLDGKLYVRPTKEGNVFQFCDDDLCWQEVDEMGEKSFTRRCKSDAALHSSYKFTALIKRRSLSGSCRDHDSSEKTTVHAEHHISLLHTVILENQLPFDLFYTLKGCAMKELIKPGANNPLSVDYRADQEIDIGFSFENFPKFDSFKVSSEQRNYVQPVRVYDLHSRVLFLSAFIKYRSGTIQISVSAPFWLVNKTGLPLVFKREEHAEEVAGQFDEHEEARSLTPLPFSFVSSEYLFTCQMRVGKQYRVNQGMEPLWSRAFSLEKDIENRTLYVRRTKDRFEKSYDIGIVTQWGKGVFKRTKIVTFVPRFQIINKTQQEITIAQTNSINKDSNMSPEEMVCHPGVVTNFHWCPKWDKILCARIQDDVYSIWSGGFRIDKESTYHLNIKSTRKVGNVTFHVRVTLNGGTFQCTFTNADKYPPPYRIVNLSDITLFYWQTGSANASTREFVRAREEKDFVMEEPLNLASITFSVYQECSEDYNLKQRGEHFNKLYYQNAIFIAFKDTFQLDHAEKSTSCQLGTHATYGNQQLVLDVVSEREIVLANKVEHKLSQLWRMSAEGYLLPFTPASSTDKRKSSRSTNQYDMVLDVEKVRAQTGEWYSALVLSKPDASRTDTQTWYFESNTLRCCVPDVVVQGRDGLVRDTRAVLAAECSKSTKDDGASPCNVFRQKLRPGSGVLSVRVYGVGPTQVVEVCDSHHEYEDSSWLLVDRLSHASGISTAHDISRDLLPSTEINVSLAGGFGVSLINLHPEEVIFASLSQIRVSLELGRLSYNVEATIGAVQVDNQLFGCRLPVGLFTTAAKSTSSSLSSLSSASSASSSSLSSNLPSSSKLPSSARISSSSPSLRRASLKRSFPTTTGDRMDVRVIVKVEKDEEYSIFVVKKLFLDVGKLYINLEDRLLLKLIQAVQTLLVTHNVSPTTEIQNLFDSHRVEVLENEMAHKLFFEDIRINQGNMIVSLAVTGDIDDDLLPIKKNLGLFFASFDAAVIVFENYVRHNVFETTSTLQALVLTFYIQTFKSQIATLLGSLDILGNPVGLIQDFTTGMEGLLKKGNVGGLLMNVAHGMSDSAAKMTGVIADGLRSASGQSGDRRDSMRISRVGSSSSYMTAGFRGFGMGMLGGLTSIITEPIEGASKRGVGGFLSGIGKGLVGTVTKPVAGVLDLASGTAAAVRTSTETTVPVPPVVRSKRNCYGPGGVLSKYSKNASEGQVVLRCFNEGNPYEMFVSMETIRPSTDRLKALLTDKGLYIVRSGPPNPENIEFHIEYALFIEAIPMVEAHQHFMDIYYYPVRARIGMTNKEHRIPIRCENERIANKVSQKANYLKSLHEESQFIVIKR